jgi:DNA-binding transcriptional ArsR family regulator
LSPGDVQLEARALRALAHPARLAILDFLGTYGPATATECARAAKVSPAACSYHMRLLARYGLVEDAGGGNGRDRPWKARGWSFDVSGDLSPAVRAAAGVLLADLVARGNRWERDFVLHRDRLSEEWSDASHISNKRLSLSPSEAQELGRRIEELCEEYRSDTPAAGAEDVALLVRLIPHRVRRR